MQKGVTLLSAKAGDFLGLGRRDVTRRPESVTFHESGQCSLE
jgi:hypothetical protein